MPKITYKEAGVDIEEGYKAVDKIKALSQKTFRPEVMSGLGGFSGLFELKNYKNPVLVSATDGVGTKLKLAFMADKHDTVGIDLVAMCVNDIITTGAEPLFFLDYIASGKIKAEKIETIVKGISMGCLESGCSLIGGETAEMPGFYANGEYDLAGFCVGIVEKEHLIDKNMVVDGDIIIGLESSGIHSNGYSLVRKLLFETNNYNLDDTIDMLGTTLKDALLEPTRIYVKAIKELTNSFSIKSISHITGGGFIENVPRSLPETVSAVINKNSWQKPGIFKLLQEISSLEELEMFNTFNMGIGMTLIVDKADAKKIVNTLTKDFFPAYAIGKVVKRTDKEAIKLV